MAVEKTHHGHVRWLCHRVHRLARNRSDDDQESRSGQASGSPGTASRRRLGRPRIRRPGIQGRSGRLLLRRGLAPSALRNRYCSTPSTGFLRPTVPMVPLLQCTSRTSSGITSKTRCIHSSRSILHRRVGGRVRSTQRTESARGCLTSGPNSISLK